MWDLISWSRKCGPCAINELQVDQETGTPSTPEKTWNKATPTWLTAPKGPLHLGTIFSERKWQEELLGNLIVLADSENDAQHQQVLIDSAVLLRWGHELPLGHLSQVMSCFSQWLMQSPRLICRGAFLGCQQSPWLGIAPASILIPKLATQWFACLLSDVVFRAFV